ncbi:MAG: hypothetical protein IID35_05880, partial [Planctomycetes bacterium]|nr:hypothetical protein [Planctomycetota bacterium]
MSRVLIAKSASGTHTDSRTSSNLETPKLRDETKLPEHGEDLGFGIASATLLTVSGGEVDRSGDHKIVWLWFNYSDTSAASDDIGLQYHVQRVLPSVARAGAIELEKLGEVIRRLWGCDSWITRERFLSFDRGKRRYERFRDEIVAMPEAGARIFVEVWPGRTLCGLIERTLAGRPFVTINMDQPGRHGLLQLVHALGQLA